MADGSPTPTPSPGAWTPGIALGLVTLLSGWRFFGLRYHLEFLDEADHVVGGWLITQGERIYDTVFSHHMPLSYLACHLVAALSPTDHLAHFRLVPWLLYSGLAWTLFAVERAAGRPASGAISGGSFLILATLLLPVFSGQAIVAESLWAPLFSTFLVLVLLPFLLDGVATRGRWLFGGALLASCLSASLVAVYPVATALLALAAGACLSGEHRSAAWRQLGPLLLGLAGTGLLALLWVGAFGSIRGLIEQGLLFNVDVYALYNPGQGTPWELVTSAFRRYGSGLSGLLREPTLLGKPPGLGLALSLLAIAAVSARLVRRGLRREGPARLLYLLALPALLALTLLFLQMRDLAFRGLPLHVAGLALVSGAIGRLAAARRHALAAGLFLSLALAAAAVARRDPSFRPRVWGPHDARLSTARAADFIARRTSPSDRVATFDAYPLVHLLARRRPAVDTTFYLPWIALWEERFERSPAACEALRQRRPRFVYLRPTRIWGYWEWSDFGACIDRTIRRDYVQVSPRELGGEVWELSPLPPPPEGPRRFVEGLATLEETLPHHWYWSTPSGRPGGSFSKSDVRFLRLSGRVDDPAAAEESRRTTLVLTGGNGVVTVPAVKTPGAGGLWNGWSAVVYPRDLRRGCHAVSIRLLRLPEGEVLESPRLGELCVE